MGKSERKKKTDETLTEQRSEDMGGNGTASCDLVVSILDVGKADAIICECGGFTFVIDAGTRADGKAMLRFLEQRNIPELDVLIISHFDKDHVGGAIDLIRGIGIRRVILPDYEPTHPDALAFLLTLEQKGIEPERLRKPCEIETGDLSIRIEPPSSYDIKGSGDHDNDFSLITTVLHGNQRLVFSGDAEKKRISEWLETNPPGCAFLKYPHHGVYAREQKDLMKALHPDHVAICDSKKNPAAKSTMKLIQKYTDSVCETKDGMITVISGPLGITMSQKKKR